MSNQRRVEEFQKSCQQAQQNYAEAESKREENKNNPPTVGFMYTPDKPVNDGVVHYFYQDYVLTWIIVSKTKNPEISTQNIFFVVPVWDLPYLQSCRRIWRNDKDVCFRLEALKGWGEAVLNFNQAQWVDEEEIKGWHLSAVVDEAPVRELYRKWHKIVFPE